MAYRDLQEAQRKRNTVMPIEDMETLLKTCDKDLQYLGKKSIGDESFERELIFRVVGDPTPYRISWYMNVCELHIENLSMFFTGMQYMEPFYPGGGSELDFFRFGETVASIMIQKRSL